MWGQSCSLLLSCGIWCKEWQKVKKNFKSFWIELKVKKWILTTLWCHKYFMTCAVIKYFMTAQVIKYLWHHNVVRIHFLTLSSIQKLLKFFFTFCHSLHHMPHDKSSEQLCPHISQVGTVFNPEVWKKFYCIN